jgi:hypothetical protein
MFIPALTACTSERMKTEGFRTLRPLLAAPQAQAEDEKTSQKRSFRCCERLRLICYNFVTKNP